MIEVAKALITKDGKHLLLKRATNSKFFAGKWDFPGGKIEPGEEAVTALQREVLEETGLIIVPGEKIGDFSHAENGQDVHLQVFAVKDFSGEIKLSEDHTTFAWVAREELNNYQITPVTKLFFDQVVV